MSAQTYSLIANRQHIICTFLVVCLHQTIYWNSRLPNREISPLSSHERLTDTERLREVDCFLWWDPGLWACSVPALLPGLGLYSHPRHCSSHGQGIQAHQVPLDRRCLGHRIYRCSPQHHSSGQSFIVFVKHLSHRVTDKQYRVTKFYLIGVKPILDW